MYDNIEVSENEEDDAVDNAGFTGNFRRVKSKNLETISEKQFMAILKADNKMNEIMRLIS